MSRAYGSFLGIVRPLFRNMWAEKLKEYDKGYFEPSVIQWKVRVLQSWSDSRTCTLWYNIIFVEAGPSGRAV
jgi:hypothetical protein